MSRDITGCRSASARSCWRSRRAVPHHRRRGRAGSGASPPRSMRCARPATAASATRAASPSSPSAAAKQGADALCLSPMHALFTADPGHFAPVFAVQPAVPQPAARRPGAGVRRRGGCPRGDCRMPAWARSFARLERRKLIDWPSAARRPSSTCCARCSTASSRRRTVHRRSARDFASFRADGGALLHQHATLRSAAGRRPGSRRMTGAHWTLDLRDPDSAAVAAFAASHRARCCSTKFLQWVADRSLAAAQAQGARGRHADRPGRRPGGRHGPDRQPCLEPAARHPARAGDRRAARPVQSARPGLGLDRVFPPRPGGRRLRPVHRHAARGAAPRRRPADRPRHGAVAAVAGAGRGGSRRTAPIWPIR